MLEGALDKMLCLERRLRKSYAWSGFR